MSSEAAISLTSRLVVGHLWTQQQQSAGLTALPEHDGFHREQEREGSIERPAMRRQILLLAGVIPGISVKAFECWDFLSSNYFDLKKLIHVT